MKEKTSKMSLIDIQHFSQGIFLSWEKYLRKHYRTQQMLQENNSRQCNLDM